MSVLNCPNRDDLKSYVVGRLPEEPAARMADHVDSCDDCQATLADIGNAEDTMVAGLRDLAAAEPFLDESQCDQAVARLEAMADDSSSATDGPPAMARLGEYRLLEELGRGGMGTVYKALHTKLDRVVALKVLPKSRMNDRRAVARFEREMRAVGAMDHPNIVRAHDAREVDGTRLLVMEYIEGYDLSELTRHHGPLPIADACELIRQAAVGLQAAHEHGLVHRDVKPSNLMLTDSGQVKLLDLGLARLADDEVPGEEMTDRGQPMGTADYIAPEQASDSHGVDIRADIYSLGCTLYKLLCGRAPFGEPMYEKTFEKMRAHVHEPIPPIGQQREEIPEELSRVMDRMLAKDPSARFATPADVVEAIGPFADGCDLGELIGEAKRSEASQAGPQKRVAIPHVEPVTAPRVRRFRRLAVAIGLMLLIGGGGIAWQIASQAEDDEGGGDRGVVIAVSDVDLEPGDVLPHDQWVDVMQYIDLDWDVVSGSWRREEDGIMVDPSWTPRVMLPLDIDGDYDLRTEFTRDKDSESAIKVVFPVGQRACELELAGMWQSAHGLGLVDGRRSYDRDNPATYRPGRLVSDRRYRILISVRTKKDDATIDVSLDGKRIITWSGKQSSLSVLSAHVSPYPNRASLGAHRSMVTFHTATFKSIAGKTRLAAHPAPPFDDTIEGDWVDLLTDVNTSRDTIHGRWFREEGAVGVAPIALDEEHVRLMLPEVVEGSYNLAAEFTRTKRNSTVAINLPVGDRECTLHFSSRDGYYGGLEEIDDGIEYKYLTAARRPSSLVNDHRYKVLVSVRLSPTANPNDHYVVIDAWLDGRPFVRWSGNESSLKAVTWEFPEPRHVGLGADKSLVTFHSVKMQKVAEE